VKRELQMTRRVVARLVAPHSAQVAVHCKMNAQTEDEVTLLLEEALADTVVGSPGSVAHRLPGLVEHYMEQDCSLLDTQRWLLLGW